MEVDWLSTIGIMLPHSEKFDMTYSEQPHTIMCFLMKNVQHLYPFSLVIVAVIKSCTYLKYSASLEQPLISSSFACQTI